MMTHNRFMLHSGKYDMHFLEIILGWISHGNILTKVED
jgi:hypothetical protein